MKWLSRKLLSLFLLSSAGVFGAFSFFKPSFLCAGQANEFVCRDITAFLYAASFYLALLLVPFLLTLPLKPVLFEYWKRFAVWAIPLVAVLTYFIVTMDTSGYIDVRPTLYLYGLYGLYFLVSIVILIIAALKKK